jgi:hypothetical protein
MERRWGHSIDDTILPGGALLRDSYWGVFLRPEERTREAIRTEVDRMILSATLGHRLATETSLGDTRHVPVRPLVSVDLLESYVDSAQNWLGT